MLSTGDEDTPPSQVGLVVLLILVEQFIVELEPLQVILHVGVEADGPLPAHYEVDFCYVALLLEEVAVFWVVEKLARHKTKRYFVREVRVKLFP